MIEMKPRTPFDRLPPMAPQAATLDRLPLVDRLNKIINSIHLGSDQISTRDANGVYRDLRMVLPTNPWKMHVARAAAQTLTTNAYTTILFDTVVYDTVNGYDSTTGQYTVPVAGTYTMDAIINVVMPAVATEQFCYISLFVNGSERRRGHGETYVNTIPQGKTISGIFSNSDSYNAGDVLKVQCWTFSGGANPATPASSQQNYWTMHLISG